MVTYPHYGGEGLMRFQIDWLNKGGLERMRVISFLQEALGASGPFFFRSGKYGERYKAGREKRYVSQRSRAK
ncbi:MAG: hypothetical protein CMN76_04010 [Spirochaetaceae bacterium]|nr:hypothetical protein [Spirochaetaceae bacterium]|tara:strand:+ start:5342 stop:5557 length:216 start_codon:yes stop_codon:yes gene_type:complete